MVEQERPEIRAAPIPESNTRILELESLAELGIDTSFDNLNLAGDRFTLGVKEVGEDRVFVGRLKHPLAGTHFAQFLNSIAPFGDQDIVGIINDVNLPILAQADYQRGKDRTTSESIRLHERHLEDPRVGPAYTRFAKGHVDNWLRALKNTADEAIFSQLQRVRFINNQEEPAALLFLEWQRIRSNIIDRKNASRISEIGHTVFGADQFTTGDWWGPFFSSSLEKQVESIDSFFNELSPQDKQKFAISHAIGIRCKILADLETMELLRTTYPPPPATVEFIDRERVEIKGINGSSIKVIQNKSLQGEDANWRIFQYTFSHELLSTCLYPDVAWRKDENGTRAFLTQEEAIPLVKELGLEEGQQGDTKLGEIAVAYFARGIIKGWEREMTLKPLEGVRSSRRDDFEQPMKGGQMPAWVGVERHKAQLLQSEDSLLAKLEQYEASAV